MKIETSCWGEFKVGDLFDIHPTARHRGSGKDLTNIELFDGGEYPVVVNSAYNNGIGGYTSLGTTENGNMITFSDTVDANTIFYQENDFAGYPHVQGLYPIGQYADNWGKYQYLFFASVFRSVALTEGFDFGNKFRRDIAVGLKVVLPIDSKHNPDWKYMEDYMLQIESKAKWITDNYCSVNSQSRYEIDISGWGEYVLSDLFDIVKGSRLTKADMIEGDINYVGASSFNNGITCKIGNRANIHPAKTLTVTYNGSDIGRTFYQEEEYWATDDVNVLYPKFNITKGIALFLAPVIKAIGGNHVYKDKWQIDDMKAEKIKLPQKSDGTPDWDYMERYSSKIETEAKKKIEAML